MLQIFSDLDVIDLKENPSDQTKLGIVNKLARNYNCEELTAEEKAVADQILRLLARDISKRIRISISEKFCQNNNIPYEVALQLANDMEEFVAIPMIQFSEVLTDEDLAEIVKSSVGEKQCAVARRNNLSENLKDCLINNGLDKTIAALADNETAKLSRSQCEKILDLHKDNTEVIKSLIENKKVSDDGTLEIIMNSSQELKGLISRKYGISNKDADNITTISKEAALLGMIKASLEKGSEDTHINTLIEKLHNKQELSFPLLVKVLSTGNTKFFYAALAKLAGIETENVRRVIEEGAEQGTEKLFIKAGFSTRLARATYELILIVRECRRLDIENIEQKVIEEIRSLSQTKEDKNLHHLFTILSY